MGQTILFGEFQTVGQPSFSGIVGRERHLHEVVLAMRIPFHYGFQSAEMICCGLDVLLRVEHVVDVIFIGRARHHLHQAYRTSSGDGFNTELGFLP